MLVKENKIDNDLLLATSKYNEFHSIFLTQKLLTENNMEYLIEDICYKENSKIPIIEESAKLKIAKRLVEAGKKVIIKDELQLINEVKKEYGTIFDYIIKQ